MERRITDLLEDALEHPDYEKRINFLLAGLISAEANDRPEKEAVNMRYLKDIYDFCAEYKGNKKEYISHMADNIKEYLK